MEEKDILPKETEHEEYSIPDLIVLANSTKEELKRFRQDVLKNYQQFMMHRNRWVNGYIAAKMLSVTVRTLRRYRLKYNIRVKTINGNCRYYYPDLLSLIKDANEENSLTKITKKKLHEPIRHKSV